MRKALYDVNWQRLRVSLQRSWNSPAGVSRALKALDRYLGNREDVTKLWRVLNLLNAVRMGHHGMSRAGSNMSLQVAQFRDRVGERYRQLRRQGRAVVPTSDEENLRAWRALTPEERQAIMTDLKKRWATSGKSPHREDLRQFVELLEQQGG